MADLPQILIGKIGRIALNLVSNSKMSGLIWFGKLQTKQGSLASINIHKNIEICEYIYKLIIFVKFRLKVMVVEWKHPKITFIILALCFNDDYGFFNEEKQKKINNVYSLNMF